MTDPMDEGRFRRLLDDVREYAIITLDGEGRVLTWNRGADEIFGQPASMAVGKYYELIYPQDDAGGPSREDRAREVLRTATRLGHCEEELLLARRDGSAFRASLVASHCPCDGQEGFVLIARDISEQVAVEQTLRRHLTMLDTLVENIPNMIFVKEAKELRFDLVNHAAEDLLGIKRGEMLGRNDYDFFPPEQADFFVQADRRTLEQGKLVDISEEPIETRHGLRWLHTRKVPLLDAQGRAEYLLGISEDITAQKEAENQIRELTVELRRRVERLSAVNRELEAFSYSVSHDLRAPLRGIDGMTHILLEEYGDALDDTGRRYLELLRGDARHMGKLIDGLLDLSRITRSAMVWEPVDLSEMAGQVAQFLREQNPDRSVEMAIQAGVTAVGDARLLRIALQSLFANAWKFTAHCETPRIEFGARTEEEGTVYFVRDNGAGFEMAFSGKLFKAFQRLHQSAEFEGSGIGLAAVSRVIQRHEGEVWAESAPGKGAVFYFTLGTTRPLADE